MKYKVMAYAKERKSGEKISEPRAEIVDTNTNEIFKTCKNRLDVKRQYEHFWNALNKNSFEVVKVISVEPMGKSNKFGGVFG